MQAGADIHGVSLCIRLPRPTEVVCRMSVDLCSQLTYFLMLYACTSTYDPYLAKIAEERE